MYNLLLDSVFKPLLAGSKYFIISKNPSLSFYGKLSKIDININGNIKTVVSIVNEYNIPLYIETINTVDIIA